MKKTYLLQSFGIAVAICLVFLFLAHSPLGSGLQIVTTSLFGPVEMSLLHGKQHIAAPPSALQKLQEENGNLKEQLAALQEVKNENQALHDQFLVTSPAPSTLLPAKIISMPGFFPGVSAPSVCVIDKGKNSGVQEGTGVVVGNNLVGIVSQVDKYTSLVMLISRSGVTFTARDNTTGALGIVRGQGNDLLLFDNVVLSDKLQVGDMVVTQGDQILSGEGIPAGLVVGQITSIDRSASDLFQKAKITSLVQVEKLTEVFLIGR